MDSWCTSTPCWLLALALVASTDRAQSVRLSGPLVSPSSDVTDFAVDPSGSRVYVTGSSTGTGTLLDFATVTHGP